MVGKRIDMTREAARRRAEVLRLHEVEGLSLAQLGERFGGVTKQAMHKLVTRARAERAMPVSRRAAAAGGVVVMVG